jgi:hypothetical protein
LKKGEDLQQDFFLPQMQLPSCGNANLFLLKPAALPIKPLPNHNFL